MSGRYVRVERHASGNHSIACEACGRTEYVYGDQGEAERHAAKCRAVAIAVERDDLRLRLAAAESTIQALTADLDKALARLARATRREPKLCTFDGCGTKVVAGGLCSGHYDQRRRGKTLTPIRRRRTKATAPTTEDDKEPEPVLKRAPKTPAPKARPKLKPLQAGALKLLAELGSADWQDEALCAQIDPELWFPEKGGSARQVKRICRECPVRAQCLAFALANDEPHGIWGGLSERERRALQRERASAKAVAA